MKQRQYTELQIEISPRNLVIGIIKDTFNNIDLTDELCARINNQTYEFIKGWKQ